MPCPPLRFLHAANVRLDSPVWLSGDTPDAIRHAAVTATTDAFRNVVQASLDRDVDFLLLGGDTFVEADHSLAARVALRDGLERLADAGIPLFVLPGPHDPPDAWHSIPDLPETVTVFNVAEAASFRTHAGSVGHEQIDPVEVTHNGEVIAIVGPDRSVEFIPHETSNARNEFHTASFRKSADADHGPFRICLRLVEDNWQEKEVRSPCDYLALGGTTEPGTQHTQTGVAHHPGTTQPLSPGASNGSCTLVEVDESRQLHLTPLPTAAVRFEHLKKTLDDSDTPGNLLETLPGKLALRPAVDGELVRCILWTLDGDGPLWNMLQSLDSCERIERELDVAATDEVPAVIHRIELVRSTHCDTLPDDLCGEFRQAFAATPDVTRDDVASRLDEIASQRPEWKLRLDQRAGRIFTRGIMARANHIGRQRLEQPATPT